MPIFEFQCACGHQQEDYLSSSAPPPEHCGKAMQKLPSVAGSAFVTKGGNWYRRTAAQGPVWKGGGRPKPKSIGRGHGLGGRRPPPSIRSAISQSGQAGEIRKLAKGKT